MGNRPGRHTGKRDLAYHDTWPVEEVSYHDIRENPNNSAISPYWSASSQVHADSFMGKLRAKTGLTTLDLPTEAQWEYACRAGTITALNSGNNLTTTNSGPNMSKVGRCWSKDFGIGPVEVGSYLPNRWGLYDMHGNVYEWCLDWGGNYPVGAVTDPVGAQEPALSPILRGRALRGGAHFVPAQGCRSASRAFQHPSLRWDNAGFRLAMTLP